MSTLNVSNITDGTTTVGTSYVVNGSAKAWSDWNGTGTAAIADSFNVSSLTDNGAGDFTNTYTNAFASASYTQAGTAASASVVTTFVYKVQPRSFGVKLASSIRTITVFSGGSSGSGDYPYNAISIHGDLA